MYKHSTEHSHHLYELQSLEFVMLQMGIGIQKSSVLFIVHIFMFFDY